MPDQQPTRVADLVARTLHGHGIRHAFGMPGGEVVTLVDGLVQAGIDFTLARHETPAAIMAAGSYWATGRPGLLVTTLGPGLANALNGIADAVQERVPLVVVSGVVERSVRGRYTHQILDQAALLRPLVKASFEIEAEDSASVVARALALACERPFGPVHLDLSPLVAASPAKDAPASSPVRASRPAVDPDDPALGAARAMLQQARAPLVIAGMDAATSMLTGPLLTLLEMLNAPLVTTYRAKGVVDEGHPLVLGAAGLSPLADAALLPLVRAADLVLLVGYDPIEMRPGWLDPFGPDARVLELTAAAPDHAMHRVDIRLIGDPAALVSALAHRLEPSRSSFSGEIAMVRDRLASAFATPDGRFRAHDVVDALNMALRRDTTVTVDSGAHRILLSQKMQVGRPLQLLQSSGWCTMGAALPLAIGVKRAAPERQVVAVMGDGGLEMVAGELATLRDLAMPVTLVVLQDASLALIALKQAQAGLASQGVRLPRSDFVALAHAFGGEGIEVQDRHALDRALQDAAANETFTLIACRIEAEDYVSRI
ncbi:thiamine pyrophosphate-binding protein [Geminicoccus roseus]|uniref:thiamine pyrophosphate-binding protein n=1 Tax=Geminicoccus roseus TaxID=404900 RepID=UPI000418D8B1|nr:thiamine pyrophosphate-binding protein [Geminicoccus roseus]